MVFPYQHQSPPPPGPVLFSHLVSEFSLHSFFDSKQPPDPQYTIFFFVASTSSIAGIAINPVTNTAPSATNSASIRGAISISRLHHRDHASSFHIWCRSFLYTPFLTQNSLPTRNIQYSSLLRLLPPLLVLLSIL